MNQSVERLQALVYGPFCSSLSPIDRAIQIEEQLTLTCMAANEGEDDKDARAEADEYKKALETLVSALEARNELIEKMRADPSASRAKIGAQAARVGTLIVADPPMAADEPVDPELEAMNAAIAAALDDANSTLDEYA